MAIQSKTLRPGLLVSLKTSVTGNVRYERQVIENEHRLDSGASKAAWQTVRVISDPAEYEAAGKMRMKIRGHIAGACVTSAFGLLCPETNEAELEKAIAEARTWADEFNSAAGLSRLHVFVMTGRIAPDDVEAVRAINSEVRELMETMQEGINSIDVKKVRDAANRARSIGAMLSPEAAARIQIAVDAARVAARKIAKAGETAAQEIDQQAIRKITEQRTAFLDIEADAKEVQKPKQRGRAVDLTPARTAATPRQRRAKIEVE